MSSLLLLANQLKEVAVGYTVGLFSLILIGVSLLIILYRIVKWIIRLDEMMSEMMSVLVVQTYKQQTNCIASCTGSKSVSECKGNFSIAANVGDYSVATSSGQYSAAINIAGYSIAESTGDYSVAVATSEKSSAKVEGKDSIAIVCGTNGKASGRLGCWLILTERGEWNGKEYTLKDVKSIKVDGKKIKEDTWYKLENGEIIEVGSSKDPIDP